MSGWFPVGRNNDNGWRLDIVSLLAVIGESAIAEHAQAMTASRLSFLPRIIPAPQVLLRPTRPSRLPQVNAGVVGVHNGTYVQSLNYFPNIIHPIESLPAFAFQVFEITHNDEKMTVKPASSSTNGVDPESQAPHSSQNLRRRRTDDFKQAIKPHKWDSNKKAPLIPPSLWSPLNLLSIFSCLMTIALLIWACCIHDGVAVVALCTISLVSSIVGYASYWKPKLMKRTANTTVPDGDVVIRTREGAFIVVKCNEDVARELYTGTEECTYTVGVLMYRALVGVGTFLLMISVVLLGNCNWTMQAAVGVAYILLNGLYWAVALIPKEYFWDMDLYRCTDITPEDARHAHKSDESIQNPSADDVPSYTRTMWFAIRETKSTGWVTRIGAAPETPEWGNWLLEAERYKNERNWQAVAAKDRLIGTDKKIAHTDVNSSSTEGEPKIIVPGEQIAPATEIPLTETR